MDYGKNTTVSVAKSRADIHKMLEDHQCDDIVHGGSNRLLQIVIQFTYELVPCRISLKPPSPQEERFHLHGNGYRLSATEAGKKYDKELRRVWRCLFLIVKARFVELDAGLFSAQQTLAPWLVMPNGRTVGELLEAGDQTLLDSLIKASGDKLLSWGGKKGADHGVYADD